MATVRAFTAFDMRTVLLPSYDHIVVQATPDSDASVIGYVTGSWATELEGVFDLRSDDSAVGSITGLRQRHATTEIFEAAGVRTSADAVLDLTQARDNDGLLAYLLSGRDQLLGSSQNDHMVGYRGADALSGDRGADTLFGRAGADTLSGGRGSDRLGGGAGADLLDGGACPDLLRGGDGRDVFRFGDATAADGDRIADFATGRDRIDLSAIGAKPALGDQAFRWICDAGFTGSAGELRFDGGTLAGDIDGDGAADFAIRLDPDADLGGADLIL